jgi:hypothetical protein
MSISRPPSVREEVRTGSETIIVPLARRRQVDERQRIDLIESKTGCAFMGSLSPGFVKERAPHATDPLHSLV